MDRFALRDAGLFGGYFNSPYFNTNSRNVVLKTVISARDFVYAWNNMYGDIDNVFLYLHGEKGRLCFNGEEIGFGGKWSFSNLKYKHVNYRVYLFSCHGGDGYEHENVAWKFAKLTGTRVYAYTGSVSYLNIFGKYFARKYFGDWGVQKTFYYEKRFIWFGDVMAKSLLGQWGGK